MSEIDKEWEIVKLISSVSISLRYYDEAERKGYVSAMSIILKSARHDFTMAKNLVNELGYIPPMCDDAYVQCGAALKAIKYPNA